MPWTKRQCWKRTALPVFSHDEIYSSVNVLQSIIPFIWTENLISAHKDLLPQKIENYINQNLTSSTLTVEKLCQTFFISKRTLYNIFHREFHDTLRSYIINKRLTLAKKMLLDTNLPISEISENCGFNDYNYFSRVFHLRYGMAPSRFRKKANSSPPREMSLKNERPFRLRQNTARQSSRSMRYNILRIGHGLQAMSA